MGRYFNKELFGQRLQGLMQDCNDTTYSLAEYLGLTAATISRYCTGDIAPKITTVKAIAEKYGVNPAWLMGTEGAGKYIEKEPNCKKVPIIGTIAAGLPILAEENHEGHDCIPAAIDADFALNVSGDSMINARILDGDIAYIRKQPDVENGEIAAVLIDDEATLKRVYKLEGSVILRAENPNYPEMVFGKRDAKKVTILGKAIYFRSEVK